MDNQYSRLSYNSKGRVLSFWYQASEALEVQPGKVLVVGKGSGITEGLIKSMSPMKVQIYTLDIDRIVTPDIVGTVTMLPFRDESFDVTICCQVLEHIPFDRFGSALHELQRVTSNRLVMSLPHGRKFVKLAFRVSPMQERTLIIKNPFNRKVNTSRHHCWEINRTVTRKQVTNEIRKYFDIEREYLNELNCYHRFYILRKAHVTGEAAKQ
jgi:hypothetical protein